MMSKVSTLLFALVALSAANVLAAPSNFGRDFDSLAVPSGSSSAMGAQKTMGKNKDHPRLWDDRYCHMPAHHEGNGTEHHPHSWHPHSSGAVPSGTPGPIGPMTGGLPPLSTSAVPSSTDSADVADPTTTEPADGDDTSGSFDGNDFDMSGGGDLDATHNSTSATSSSSNDDDTLHISS